MHTARTLLLLLAFISVSTLTAQAGGASADYDRVMNDFIPADGPGATVLVAKDGTIVYHAAFGKANLELDVDMKTEHVFRIGSITKQFTAAAILKLAEEKKLALTDALDKYLPKFPNGKNITITQLLNHTSGIKSYTSLKKWDEAARRVDFTPDEMVGYFKFKPAGIKIRFNVEDGGTVPSFTLFQGGGEQLATRKSD